MNTNPHIARVRRNFYGDHHQSMISVFSSTVQFVPMPTLGEPSLVPAHGKRICSLHQTAPRMEPVRLQDVIGRVESGTETENDSGRI